MSCPRANAELILSAGQISYPQLGRLQYVYKSCTFYDTGMGDQPNGSFFLGLLLLHVDIYQLTVTCFMILLTSGYMLICSAKIYIYINIQRKKCITLHLPAWKQPGETKGQGSDQ